MRTADSWQQTRGHNDRPPISSWNSAADVDLSAHSGSGYRRPAVPPPNRPHANRTAANRPPAERRRVSDRYDEREMNRGSADYRRAPARDAARSGRVPESDRPSRRPQPNDTGARPARRPTPGTDGRLRGAVALAVVFLGTLAGAAVDSFVGTGLGTITLGALVATTVVAALLVRRRDLLSLVVAPPLIFVAVALTNIALAPSASFSLPTLATLLIRGFPAMAAATGAAAVIALLRALARR